MEVTAQWIADQCGVSRGTADRVILERPDVAPDVRERVKRLVNGYGYQAHRQAARVDQPALRIAVIAAGWDVFSMRRLRGGMMSMRHYFDRCDIQVEVEEFRENRQEPCSDALTKLEPQHIDGLGIAAPGDDFRRVSNPVDNVLAGQAFLFLKEKEPKRTFAETSFPFWS